MLKNAFGLRKRDFQSDFLKANARMIDQHLLYGGINAGGNISWVVDIKWEGEVSALWHENMNNAVHGVVKN